MSGRNKGSTPNLQFRFFSHLVLFEACSYNRSWPVKVLGGDLCGCLFPTYHGFYRKTVWMHRLEVRSDILWRSRPGLQSEWASCRVSAPQLKWSSLCVCLFVCFLLVGCFFFLCVFVLFSLFVGWLFLSEERNPINSPAKCLRAFGG